jgi:ankyrin repeat protein
LNEYKFTLQHVDIAALLIKFNTCVNAVDRWGFTPLHEAAQKGRTQLCALLVIAKYYIGEYNSFLFISLLQYMKELKRAGH